MAKSKFLGFFSKLPKESTPKQVSVSSFGSSLVWLLVSIPQLFLAEWRLGMGLLTLYFTLGA